MYVTLTIVRYPSKFSWAGILSMALFRLPLSTNKGLGFYKLLGCGKNGTFDKTPDLRQWGVLAAWDQLLPSQLHQLQTAFGLQALHKNLYGKLVSSWWRSFKCETWTIVLQPIEGHGVWDGKQVFGALPKNSTHEGLIAVLTRATIRLNKLGAFWKNVEGAARGMATSAGFVTSLGVGEVPWVKQATFSIWESKAAMKDFAYRLRNHADVIKKTRQENWYKEEMFTRFFIVASYGTLNGKNPLEGLL